MMDRRQVAGTILLAATVSGRAYAKASRDMQAPAAGGRSGWAIAADGERIRYAVYGRGAPAFVLIHGWCCDRSYWNGQVEALSTGATVVTLDLVGCGESSRTRRAWSVEGLGDDVAEVVSAAGAGRVVLVGHSMGGSVALEAARRLGSQVAGIVTIDTLFSLAPQAGGDLARMTPATFRDGVSRLVRGGLFTPTSDRAVVDRVSAAMASADPTIALPLVDALARYDVRPGLSAVAATPLTMIDAAGRPVDEAALRSAHPGLRIVTVAGTGHFIMLEAPATLNALLRVAADEMDGTVRSL